VVVEHVEGQKSPSGSMKELFFRGRGKGTKDYKSGQEDKDENGEPLLCPILRAGRPNRELFNLRRRGVKKKGNLLERRKTTSVEGGGIQPNSREKDDQPRAASESGQFLMRGKKVSEGLCVGKQKMGYFPRRGWKRGDSAGEERHD